MWFENQNLVLFFLKSKAKKDLKLYPLSKAPHLRQQNTMDVYDCQPTWNLKLLNKWLCNWNSNTTFLCRFTCHGCPKITHLGHKFPAWWCPRTNWEGFSPQISTRFLFLWLSRDGWKKDVGEFLKLAALSLWFSSLYILGGHQDLLGSLPCSTYI